jgi:hypothetical protein
MVRIAFPQEETLDIEVQAPTLKTYVRRYWGAEKTPLRTVQEQNGFIGAVMLVILFSACILTPICAL